MRRSRRTVFFAMLAAAASTALTQESGDGETSVADDDERALAREERLDQCVSAPAILDISVLTDAYVYVRTRGNHYLLTTAECEGLLRSYERQETRLVPYGRTLCQGDGSYILYRPNNAQRTCPILTVDRVTDRREAREIAAGEQSAIEVKKVEPAP